MKNVVNALLTRPRREHVVRCVEVEHGNFDGLDLLTDRRHAIIFVPRLVAEDFDGEALVEFADRSTLKHDNRRQSQIIL